MVIRKYTPPTCTLEIKAQESPLSRWVGQPVLKQLRFELHFDDPRQSEEKRVTLWGDRAELEALHEAVTNYVQNFLSHTPALLPVGRLESALLAAELPTPRLPAAKNGAVQDLDFLSPQLSGNLVHLPNSGPTLYLQPRGLLTHDLFLGPLETEESGPFVSLSALQIFDLATALDEYAAEMVALPQLSRPIWRLAPPPWAKTAAMVVLTVGLTTAAVKLLDKAGGSPQKAAQAPSPTPSPAQQTPPAVAQVPVVPPPPGGMPTATPTATATPPLAKPLLNTPGRLLPPPPVGAPPAGGQFSVNPGGSPPPLIIPEIGAPSRSTSPPPPQGSSPLLIPRTTANESNSNRVAAKQQPGARPQPQRTQSQPEQAAPPAPMPAPAPTIAQLSSPPPLSGSRRKQEDERQNSAPQLSASSAIPSASSDSNSGGTRSRSAPSSVDMGRTRSLQEGTTDNAPDGRLFDSVPQVAQIRKYFLQRWKPPEELTKPLEYNLVLNENGSIERIISLGSAAATYLNRTNMPTPGQPFVSAFDTGSTPTVRLVLYPDGQVETFLEPTK